MATGGTTSYLRAVPLLLALSLQSFWRRRPVFQRRTAAGGEAGKAVRPNSKGKCMASVYDTRQANTPTDTRVPKQQESSSPEEARDRSLSAQLRDKAEEMGTQIRSTAEEIGSQLRDKAREMSTQAQELGTQAKETVSEYYEQGRETLRTLPQTMEVQIRARPLEALLVAGGVGLLLGLLWRKL